LSDEANSCLVLDSSAIIALAEVNIAGIIELLGMEIIAPHAVYEGVISRASGHEFSSGGHAGNT